MSDERTNVLSAAGIEMTFGGNRALDFVDIAVAQGEWLGLVGPNGSGKTTLLNVLSALYRPRSGRVSIEGKLAGRTVRSRALAGVGRTFQHPQLAETLTLEENMLLGMDLSVKRFGRANYKELVARGHDIIELFHYTPFLRTLPNDAPYGARKAIEIARAIVSRPSLLLLDEPAAGLSLDERNELIGALRSIQEQTPDLAVCMVEHDLRLVAAICPNIQVLNFGKTIARGAAQVVLADPEVQRAYLGSRPLGLNEEGRK